jgi:ATP-dependent RNA helicase SrmB
LRPANKEAKPTTKKKISNKTKKAVIKAKRTAKIKKRKNKGRGKKTP